MSLAVVGSVTIQIIMNLKQSDMEQSYKEKYEQAIERIKQWDREHPCAGYVLSDRDKFIFPELAESEDERIMKRISQALHGDVLDFDEIIQADAWLKKQGNNSIRWNENTDDNKPQKHHSVLMKTIHGIAEGEWQGEKWFQYRWSGRLKDDDVLSWVEFHDLEKQGETKPEENKGNIGGISANWSEEDKRIIDNLVSQLGNLCTRNLIKEETKDKYVNWLKSLKDRVQPKQEWGEEDEAVLDALIRKFEGENIYVSPHLAVECLKSLKDMVLPQPKQEWSEEEIEKAAKEWDSKANFNPFYMTMDGDKPTGVLQDITTHKESFKAGVNWILKSLRPQNRWKPSEEQLNNILDVLSFDNCTPKRRELLESLYEQLKKLKEEKL